MPSDPSQLHQRSGKRISRDRFQSSKPHSDLALEDEEDKTLDPVSIAKAENQRPTQIEWDDEADFIFDEDEDLPYPG